jgi:hypothetical protein
MLPILFAALLSAAPASAGKVLESEAKTYPARGLSALHLNFTVGELRVEGTDADQIVVQLFVHCRKGNDRCADMAEDLSLDARTRGNQLYVEVDGHSMFDADDYWVEGVLEVPSRLNLDIDMPVGEAHVSGMKADVDLRLKVGEASIDMREEHVSRVSAAVTIGAATIDQRDGREEVEGLFGRKIRWIKGKGKARVDLSIGVGEATVTLN